MQIRITLHGIRGEMIICAGIEQICCDRKSRIEKAHERYVKKCKFRWIEQKYDIYSQLFWLFWEGSMKRNANFVGSNRNIIFIVSCFGYFGREADSQSEKRRAFEMEGKSVDDCKFRGKKSTHSRQCSRSRWESKLQSVSKLSVKIAIDLFILK